MSKCTKIGDYFTLQRGFDITKSEQTEGVFPVVSSSGINSYHNEFKVEGPGVVIGRKGTLGTAFYIPTNFWPHDTSLWVKNFKGNDPKYIYYFLKGIPLEKLDSGSANPTLNRNVVHLVQAVFPEVKIQSQIAKILSDIDRKIELNNKINVELEAMVKLIYDYWFVQFDFLFDFAQGKPDENGKPYKSSGGKMVWNEELKREIPEGWEVGSLPDIAIFTNGIACQQYRPESDEFLPVIKIKEMRCGFTEATERVTVNIPEKVMVFDGDVLFSWSASLEVMIWSGGNGGLNQHIFKVTAMNKYPKSFYYFELLNYLRHFKMIAELRKTTMGHITLDHLKQSRIIIPPIIIINNLDKKLVSIIEQIIKNNKQKNELEKLRDWLLPMLMNGQVTVGDTEE